ncbi:IncN plasmid KikA protein [Salmonella enterica]|nr:IncN plasmid KikA protein [Salmonella enterica]
MKRLVLPLIAAGSLLYLPVSHAADPCAVIVCMGGKLTGNSGGSDCNSAEAAFFNIVKKKKHGFSPGRTKDAREQFLNECPDEGEGGNNKSLIKQIISKYGKVRL